MKKLLPLAFVLFCVSAACFGLEPPAGGAAQAAPASPSTALSDIAQIRDRYALSVLPTDPAAIEYVHAQGAKYGDALKPDGSWAEVDYGDTTLPYWAATEHLQHLLAMAKSARLYRNAGHPDEALEGKILLAYKWWTDHDYQNRKNPALWWWNEIGVPELVGESATLMSAQIPPAEMAKLVAIMKRSNWQHGVAGRWTGANLTWGVINQIARGCMENNPDTVAEAYARMYDEIKVVSPNDDGIQQDDSFHQHGKQIYSGGYGLAFANDAGRFISFAWGTRFQIPADRMAIFSAYILDGLQWFIRGNIIDYSTVGREIARPGKAAVPRTPPGGPISPAGAEYSLGNVISLLAVEPTPRQKEFQAFAARLNTKPDAGSADTPDLIGNKQFWCSDFMVHRRAGFYTSVKMMSTRIRNGELINTEGKKSQHLSDGVNLLYLTGDEYKDIFPVWDWTRLPGITAIQGTLDTGEKDPINELGTTTFNGGVSDGTYGMAAMDLARGKLTAKKAWFFFDSGYVALGAAINLTGDPNHGVVTDVNQTLLAGDVITSQSSSPVPAGTQTYNSPDTFWVYHNHVGYFFGLNFKISLSAGPQTGLWTDLGFGPTQPVTLPVFNLWIDHGNSPQDATYQYTVLPNTTPEQMARYAKLPDMEVLSNSDSIQAVYSSSAKVVEAAFRQAGPLVTPLGEIEVDHSCLLLVRKTDKGYEVTASNPENQPLALNLAVSQSQTAIQLPGGNLAGSSVTVEMK
jgi:chondroitin AC lyase